MSYIASKCGIDRIKKRHLLICYVYGPIRMYCT